MSNLSTLSKRELKTLADEKGILYPWNISRDNLEALIVEADEVVELVEQDLDIIEVSGIIGWEKTFEVVSNIEHNGRLYSQGESIVLEKDEEIDALLAGWVIK